MIISGIQQNSKELRINLIDLIYSHVQIISLISLPNWHELCFFLSYSFLYFPPQCWISTFYYQGNVICISQNLFIWLGICISDNPVLKINKKEKGQHILLFENRLNIKLICFSLSSSHFAGAGTILFNTLVNFPGTLFEGSSMIFHNSSLGTTKDLWRQ